MTTTAKHLFRSGAGAALRVGIGMQLALLSVIIGLFASGPTYADEVSLHSLSLRARFSGATTLGDKQPEEFQEVDLAAHYRLPWLVYDTSGWDVGTQMMVSAGIIRGAGESGLIVSLIPGFVYGNDDGSVTLDMGAGFALFSRHRFGTQDYGGPFQFALTSGISIPLYKRLGLGYRFLHYSDAGINGSDTTGADFHMIELRYRF